jgi:hypothetical protein
MQVKLERTHKIRAILNVVGIYDYIQMTEYLPSATNRRIEKQFLDFILLEEKINLIERSRGSRLLFLTNF